MNRPDSEISSRLEICNWLSQNINLTMGIGSKVKQIVVKIIRITVFSISTVVKSLVLVHYDNNFA